MVIKRLRKGRAVASFVQKRILGVQAIDVK